MNTKRKLGIEGRPNHDNRDGGITRFGWKAQTRSLDVFAAEALALWRPTPLEDDSMNKQEGELVAAAEKGDGSRLRALLAQGVNPNALDGQGVTGLHRAAERGRVECLRLLLNAGANVNARDPDGSTPLHDGTNNIECVRLLLAHKADVNAANGFGTTPLMRASEEYTVSAVVGLLLQKGANVNARDRASMTPLMSAIPVLNLEAVKILLAAGADVNVRNAAGETALSMLGRLFVIRPKLRDRSLAESGEKVNVEIRTLLIGAGAVP